MGVLAEVALVLDDGAGVDDGVWSDVGAGVDDRARGDERAWADLGGGGDDRAGVDDGDRGVGEAGERGEDAGACGEVAERDDPSAACDEACLGEGAESRERARSDGGDRAWGVVEHALDAEAREACGFGDDDGVPAATDQDESWCAHASTIGRRRGVPVDFGMDALRIAYVRYLNTRPLVEGLEKAGGVELIPAAPSHIADLVADGRADVGLVSLVDAAKAGARLALLPVGMIGCDGATLTVRLHSAASFERVRRVYADVESHTSVALCRVLLWSRFGVRPEFAPFDARERSGAAGGEEWPETLLVIGDKVVTDPPPDGRYGQTLDLGAAWREWTGLPFVYAVWMCRADEAGTARIASACALLDRQRRRNGQRLGWIVARRAPEHRWPADLAREYVGDLLRFRVGEREREAVGRFLREAEALGIVDRSELQWVESGQAA